MGAFDIVIALGPPGGDPVLARSLATARERGALTLALPGADADVQFNVACDDEHVHQEVFELLGHALYESVHVYLEHRGRGDGAGSASFLYPFLCADVETPVDDAHLAASILRKVDDGERLREIVAETQNAGARGDRRPFGFGRTTSRARQRRVRNRRDGFRARLHRGRTGLRRTSGALARSRTRRA